MKDKKVMQFIDTNIFVYAYNSTDKEKQERASYIISELWNTREGCLSIQVLQEFFVVTTQKSSQPLPSSDAIQIIQDLSLWNCHIPHINDILNAINLQQHYQLSYWDALIITSAKALNCKLLWSEDLNHGQKYGGLEVINPFASS